MLFDFGGRNNNRNENILINISIEKENLIQFLRNN